MNKKLLWRGMLLALPFLAACESETKYGKCIGLNGEAKPELRYEYSARNIIVGIMAIEMVIPTVVVVLDELRCPVAPSSAKAAVPVASSDPSEETRNASVSDGEPSEERR